MQARNKLITGIIAGVLLLAFAGGASAVMTAEDLEAKKAERDIKKEEIQADREEKKEELDAKKEEKKAEIQEKRCEQIRERIQTRTQKFEGNNKYHQKNFNSINKNIDELLVLFKAEGLNVSDLESYLAVLETKLEKLYTDHDIFVSALESSSEVDCDDIENGIKNKLQLARKDGEVIKADILDIKDYYKEVIRPELLVLKKEYLNISESDLDGIDED
jgi:gas vesicle protein